MRLLGDGQLHLMDHMLGGYASKKKIALEVIIVMQRTRNGLVFLVNHTLEEVLSNFHELGFDGLNNPEIVSNNSVIAFKTAIWFWMTKQKPKPSCHNVMVGRYVPKKNDLKVNNRTAGFGLTTNIINGGLECGIPNDGRVNDRIGYFKRYAALFNVATGPNLDCENQKPF
ncbi:hypothetical protein Leryth_005592 [Lithospermum erythrorhizon]|nr:hypothetical protein Leryth_005592 [Lithospermum erythrorhizon]